MELCGIFHLSLEAGIRQLDPSELVSEVGSWRSVDLPCQYCVQMVSSPPTEAVPKQGGRPREAS